ncbi:NUDIX domain-containing protein [Pedobacter nyackensis]|uniref:Predicted NTP pyrophosphohydrolase, NUDIX family n=1 Tax=Pedobacter nyackensis TaxID=475255 RepID=A0A1W2AMX1_9SPHI|nr:NUDIX domain-containing protein [Pedobacter nyackensis]SMC61880.1 Predicted NTP pyrophosphohydrolase, NUDIX family [Pedobacter nyackensis]
MAKESAGILLYRIKNTAPEVLLVHPGGPFFRNKDRGWWTVPKGELLPGELALETALREFKEETGYLPAGDFIVLSAVVQKGGKIVHAWAVRGDLDETAITCNTFTLEWPPKSGKRIEFPEIDKAGWFSLSEAKEFINKRQQSFLEELGDILGF